MSTYKTTERLVVAAIAVLFILVCYSRFMIYSEIYQPLFLSSFDKTLFPNDIYVADNFFRHGALIFYLILEFVGIILNRIDAIHTLYILFVLNNLFCLWICYKFARQIGNRLCALLFIVILFGPFEYLRGADVSIAYNHILCGTAFAFPFAVWSILCFIKRNYTGMLVTLFLASALSVKTGFAIGAPLSIAIGYRLFVDSESRIAIYRSLAILGPIILCLAGFVVFGRDSMHGCDLLEIMIEREGNETDVLKNIYYIRGRPYYFVFINLVAIWIVKRDSTQYGWLPVRSLLIAANGLLVLGIMVSYGSTHYEFLKPFMLLAWPKLAIVPTLFSLVIVTKYVVERDDLNNHKSINLINLFLFSGIFCAFLNLDLFDRNHQILRLMLVLFLTVLAFFRLRPNFIKFRRTNISGIVITVLGLTFSQLAIAGFNAKNIYEEAREDRWPSLFYRSPAGFDKAEWDVAQWLNKQDKMSGLAVFLNLKGEHISIGNLRRFSTVSMYLTGKASDIYGSCSRKQVVERRIAIVRLWLETGGSENLRKEGVRWIISKKVVSKILKSKTRNKVFENDKFVVFVI